MGYVYFIDARHFAIVNDYTFLINILDDVLVLDLFMMRERWNTRVYGTIIQRDQPESDWHMTNVWNRTLLRNANYYRCKIAMYCNYEMN